MALVLLFVGAIAGLLSRGAMASAQSETSRAARAAAVDGMAQPGLPAVGPIDIPCYQVAAFNRHADTTPCSLRVEAGHVRLTRNETVLLEADASDVVVTLAATAHPLPQVRHHSKTFVLSTLPRPQLNRQLLTPDLVASDVALARRISCAVRGETPPPAPPAPPGQAGRLPSAAPGSSPHYRTVGVVEDNAAESHSPAGDRRWGWGELPADVADALDAVAAYIPAAVWAQVPYSDIARCVHATTDALLNHAQRAGGGTASDLHQAVAACRVAGDHRITPGDVAAVAAASTSPLQILRLPDSLARETHPPADVAVPHCVLALRTPGAAVAGGGYQLDSVWSDQRHARSWAARLAVRGDYQLRLAGARPLARRPSAHATPLDTYTLATPALPDATPSHEQWGRPAGPPIAHFREGVAWFVCELSVYSTTGGGGTWTSDDDPAPGENGGGDQGGASGTRVRLHLAGAVRAWYPTLSEAVTQAANANTQGGLGYLGSLGGGGLADVVHTSGFTEGCRMELPAHLARTHLEQGCVPLAELVCGPRYFVTGVPLRRDPIHALPSPRPPDGMGLAEAALFAELFAAHPHHPHQALTTARQLAGNPHHTVGAEYS